MEKAKPLWVLLGIPAKPSLDLRLEGRCASLCGAGSERDVHSAMVQRKARSHHLDGTLVRGTATIMSHGRQLHLTMAPASRHTRAMVRSVGRALERNLPDLGRTPLCRPSLSNGDPHSQRDSVTWVGNLILSRRRVWNKSGCAPPELGTRGGGTGPGADTNEGGGRGWEETDFGQSRFGHPDLAYLGHFWPS